jgi:predicted O-methyltransferase YrrM
MIADYLHYIYHSHNLHGVHSPFVYDMNVNVLNRRPHPLQLRTIDTYREGLRNSNVLLEVDDPGSGSRVLKNRVRKVGDIHRKASINRRLGEILFNMVRYYRPKRILELGTCLGVGTATLGKAADSDTQITTIEGSRSLYDFTKSYYSEQTMPENVRFIRGDFDEVLPGILSAMPEVDLAVVDGNHTYEATLRYFEMFKPKMHSESVLIFDDIYWSEGMKKAWGEIKKDPSVKCTVDIFRWGIVLFRSQMQKEDFVLRFDGFLQAHIG